MAFIKKKKELIRTQLSVYMRPSITTTTQTLEWLSSY